MNEHIITQGNIVTSVMLTILKNNKNSYTYYTMMLLEVSHSNNFILPLTLHDMHEYSQTTSSLILFSTVLNTICQAICTMHIFMTNLNLVNRPEASKKTELFESAYSLNLYFYLSFKAQSKKKSSVKWRKHSTSTM